MGKSTKEDNMTFEDFARAHGLIIDATQVGRWTSVPTEDHPRKRNGRYKFLGDVGWVQNWATMSGPVMWRSDRPNIQVRLDIIEKDNKAREQAAIAAAKKAAWIMHQTKLETHPYLEKKGFAEERVPVWETDGKRLLVVPMRIAGRLVGVQLIDDNGEKKFLYGQTTKGATFSIDAKGIPIFVEGFATGLSVRAAMKAAKIRYTIYICFSARNLEEVANNHARGLVVADNDANRTGEIAAQKTKHPYWISPTTGQDFNDYHLMHGLFKASQSLKLAVHGALSSGAGTLPQSHESVHG